MYKAKIKTVNQKNRTKKQIGITLAKYAAGSLPEDGDNRRSSKLKEQVKVKDEQADDTDIDINDMLPYIPAGYDEIDKSHSKSTLGPREITGTFLSENEQIVIGNVEQQVASSGSELTGVKGESSETGQTGKSKSRISAVTSKLFVDYVIPVDDVRKDQVCDGDTVTYIGGDRDPFEDVPWIEDDDEDDDDEGNSDSSEV